MVLKKIKNYFFLLQELYSSFGLKWMVSYIIMKILRKLGLLTEVELLKIKSSRFALNIFSNRVMYGPFEGMIISENAWWGHDDFPSKLVGEYEKHVFNEIINNAKSYNFFMDIGAADGYYAVGLVKAKIFESACCFEISKIGRNVISKNARNNNVFEKISIYSQANADEILHIIHKHGPALILCDIEGDEFNLFDNLLLSKLTNCLLIIELHDQYVKNGSERLSTFIENASKYFELKFIARISPSVHLFEEFNSISDNQKMLMFSEGRPSVMQWIKLSPKNLYTKL
jgi:hypothetical protein